MKPSYLKIKDEIVKLIDIGEFKVGGKLPSEIEMARRFNVSRETFRSAVKLLDQEGRLIVKHGVGTFVLNPLPFIPNRVENLDSITSMIQAAGLQEGEQKEKVKAEPCQPEWKDALQLAENEPVIVIERIRTADGEPVVVSKNIIPQKIVGDDMLNRETIGSLFKFLEEECQIYITCADTELQVPLHIDKLCQKLLITPETTVLMMKQIHYHFDNTPVLYSMDYFRNDIFKFWVRRIRG